MAGWARTKQKYPLAWVFLFVHDIIQYMERLHTREIIPDKRKELVVGLKEKGIENPEVLEALNVWTAERERIVEGFGNTPEARLGFEVDRAKLYADGGYRDEALDMLHEALYVAQQENRPQLEERIRKEIDGMERIG